MALLLQLELTGIISSLTISTCSRNKRGRPSAATMASNARADLRERKERFVVAVGAMRRSLNESHSSEHVRSLVSRSKMVRYLGDEYIVPYNEQIASGPSPEQPSNDIDIDRYCDRLEVFKYWQYIAPLSHFGGGLL
ncbi:hypothetical protein K449DRAFT_450288 [Hypoxylon sp. EC38]|nr:hypothetical protein K449DRAFT_450288 [Hypoxylon sp. EC38]